jgi:hypothetical protein
VNAVFLVFQAIGAISFSVGAVQSFWQGHWISGTLYTIGALLCGFAAIATLSEMVGGIDVPLPPVRRRHNCPLCHSSPCKCRG